MTGFSHESRRYNNLFCLAVHEVQSSDDTREIKMNSPMMPANVRLHGTMYRKVLSTTDNKPLRYLVVDPLERRAAVAKYKLDLKIVHTLEKQVCNTNPLMKQIKNSLPSRYTKEKISRCTWIGMKVRTRLPPS